MEGRSRSPHAGVFLQAKVEKGRKLSLKSPWGATTPLKALKMGFRHQMELQNFSQRLTLRTRELIFNKKRKSTNDIKTQAIPKRSLRPSKLESSKFALIPLIDPLYAGLPKSLKSQLQNRPHKMPSSKEVKPAVKASSKSIFPPALVAK